MGAEVTTVSNTGAKKGVKKQRFDLVPPRAVMELAKLYGRGAQKYAPNNFRLGYETSKSFGAGQRHGVLFWSGEDYDTEMGCHHLASFAWHCFTILESNLTHPAFDDRPYGASLADPDAVYAQTDEPLVLSIAEPAKELSTVYRHDLIPLYPFAQVAEVFGTQPSLAKFEDDVTYGSLYASMQDHANRYWSGENDDAASGLPNLAWASAYAFLLLELALSKPEADDRFLLGAALGYDSVPVVAAAIVEVIVPEAPELDDDVDFEDLTIAEELERAIGRRPLEDDEDGRGARIAERVDLVRSTDRYPAGA